MASQWYYNRNGGQYGPVTTEQLRGLPASGQLAPDDLVWKEGMAEWLPAKKLNGLFPSNMESTPVPPPIPPKMKQPPPVPVGTMPPVDPIDPMAVLTGASASMRNLTASAAAKAKQVNAAIPDRISVGKIALPKKIAIGAAAALMLAGIVILWPKSKPEPGHESGENSSNSSSPSIPTVAKSFKQQIVGEWVAADGSDGIMQVQNDKVVLSGMGLSVSQVFHYDADDANQVITFTVPHPAGDIIWTAKLNDDHRMYAQQQGRNEVVAFAREYKGGWHQEGEIDRGRRLPGMDRYDRHPEADARSKSGSKGESGEGSGNPTRNPGETAGEYQQRLNPTNDPAVQGLINGGNYTHQAADNIRALREASEGK